MVIAGASAVFAGPIDDKCTTIYDAITAGDIQKAENMTLKIYAQKSNCTAQNLADLAIIYHQLTQKSVDAVTRYDYALKAIDCYKAAVAKDAAAANAQFSAKGVDMATVVKDYNANMSKFQQAVTESMNF